VLRPIGLQQMSSFCAISLLLAIFWAGSHASRARIYFVLILFSGRVALSVSVETHLWPGVSNAFSSYSMV
jgi:hypothetical protein